jgi:hypothetical protein
MALTNGYVAEQSNSLYTTDGTITDWMWANQGIFAFAMEMYPTSADPAGGGFYPPDEVIAAQTARNRSAVLLLAQYADCPYRAILKQSQYCGSSGAPRVGHTGDMNGDGKADLTWYNRSTGETRIWSMHGNQVVGDAAVVGTDGRTMHVTAPFEIVGTGDADGDGKADLTWYNRSTGETRIWSMRGNQFVADAPVIDADGRTKRLSAPNAIVGNGDADGDGDADLTWYNTSTTETRIWYMRNNKVIADVPVVGADGQSTHIGAPYSIVGDGDANGDGYADLTWYNGSTGEARIWYMMQNQVIADVPVVGADGQSTHIGAPYSIVDNGDANGDGYADLTWYNGSTGEARIWYLRGNQVIADATVVGTDGQPTHVGEPYSIVG